MTLKSGKVYSNTGTPSNTYGVDGDIYIQLDGLKTTYRKEGAVWVAVGSSLGAIPEIISGTGVPSSLLGADGQYYRNVENQDIYYKGGGLWSAIGNLQGLAFQALLIQHGIGKDLNTPPNLINSGSLNSYITQGEFYFTNTVANRPFEHGLMKVWRENSTYTYQLVQGAGDAGIATRYSGDGGATWQSWRYPFSGGLATISNDGLVRKATALQLASVTANVWPDAETIAGNKGYSTATNGYLKLPDWLGGFIIQWGYNSNTVDIVTTISFPITFPNSCLNVQATGEATSNPDRAELITLEILNTSQFKWYGAGANPDDTIAEPSKGWWLAVGY